MASAVPPTFGSDEPLFMTLNARRTPGIGRSSRANKVRFSQDALSRRRPSLVRNLGTIFPIQAINSITKLFIPHFAAQINVKGEENLTWRAENVIIIGENHPFSVREADHAPHCTLRAVFAAARVRYQ